MVAAHRTSKTSNQRNDDFNALTFGAWWHKNVLKVSRCCQRKHEKIARAKADLRYICDHFATRRTTCKKLTFRQAHNLKVVGSNPTPATKKTNISVIKKDAILRGCVFFCSWLGVFSDFTVIGRQPSCLKLIRLGFLPYSSNGSV